MKKTAIVTGSSRGIGFAIAKQLGLDGYNIVMVATGPQEKNQHALDELKAMGINCAYVQANIGSADDRKKILDGALAAFGRVDVLVNNAGVAPKVRADLLDMSEESFDYVVGINTKGNMFLTQLVAKQMISQEPVDGRKGVIVNVSSCSSVVSSTNRGEYCVSKAGISMLTTLYADRLASEGILVNEVRPGVIATDMTSKVQGKYDALIEKGTFPIARWAATVCATPPATTLMWMAASISSACKGATRWKTKFSAPEITPPRSSAATRPSWAAAQRASTPPTACGSWGSMTSSSSPRTVSAAPAATPAATSRPTIS